MLHGDSRTLDREVLLFLVGGFLYCMIELLFRGRTYLSMMILGGVCFMVIGLINEYFRGMPLISQMFISSIIITVLEFLTGCALNLWLHIGVWDYSDQPYNLLGQICLLFTNAWFFLSLVGIILDDYLRHILFHKKMPKYHLFM